MGLSTLPHGQPHHTVYCNDNVQSGGFIWPLPILHSSKNKGDCMALVNKNNCMEIIFRHILLIAHANYLHVVIPGSTSSCIIRGRHQQHVTTFSSSSFKEQDQSTLNKISASCFLVALGFLHIWFFVRKTKQKKATKKPTTMLPVQICKLKYTREQQFNLSWNLKRPIAVNAWLSWSEPRACLPDTISGDQLFAATCKIQ